MEFLFGFDDENKARKQRRRKKSRQQHVEQVTEDIEFRHDVKDDSNGQAPKLNARNLFETLLQSKSSLKPRKSQSLRRQPSLIDEPDESIIEHRSIWLDAGPSCHGKYDNSRNTYESNVPKRSKSLSSKQPKVRTSSNSSSQQSDDSDYMQYPRRKATHRPSQSGTCFRSSAAKRGSPQLSESRKLHTTHQEDNEDSEYESSHPVSNNELSVPVKATSSKQSSSENDSESDDDMDAFWNTACKESDELLAKSNAVSKPLQNPRTKRRRGRPRLPENVREQRLKMRQTVLKKKKVVAKVKSTRSSSTLGNTAKHAQDGEDELSSVTSEHNDEPQWPKLQGKTSAEFRANVGPLQLAEDSIYGPMQVPAGVHAYLKGFQVEGVKFMADRLSSNESAILNHDMGLGKTIQVVALLCAMYQKTGYAKQDWDGIHTRYKLSSGKSSRIRGPTLIVAPASVNENWLNELKTWGCFDASLYSDAKGNEARRTMLDEYRDRVHEVLIVSYDALRTYVDAFNKVPWDLVVFDEVHYLKNPSSQMYLAATRLLCTRRIGLTGTLMSNALDELWAITDVMQKGYLGSFEYFKATYGDPIKQSRRKSANPRTLVCGSDARRALSSKMNKICQRRTKEVELKGKLSKKTEKIVFCALSNVQARIYKRILEMPDVAYVREQLTTKSDGTEDLAQFKNGLFFKFYHEDNCECKRCPLCILLPLTTKLFQVANHPELLLPNKNCPVEKQERDEEFAEAAFGPDKDEALGKNNSCQFLTDSDTSNCGKLIVLKKLLQHWHNDPSNKVLVFSQSVRMLNVLTAVMQREGYTYGRLDGSTPMKTRQTLVDGFNKDDTFVFLISTRAGGTGLNMTGANIVVIFDPMWNPAHDQQAQDRAYRMGQFRDVKVYRLVTLGTVQEMIYMRQIYKNHISNVTMDGAKEERKFEGVQGVPSQQGELFGAKNLLRYSENGFLPELNEKLEDEQGYLIIDDQLQDEGVEVDSSTIERQTSTNSSLETEKDPEGIFSALGTLLPGFMPDPKLKPTNKDLKGNNITMDPDIEMLIPGSPATIFDSDEEAPCTTEVDNATDSQSRSKQEDSQQLVVTSSSQRSDANCNGVNAGIEICSKSDTAVLVGSNSNGDTVGSNWNAKSDAVIGNSSMNCTNEELAKYEIQGLDSDLEDIDHDNETFVRNFPTETQVLSDIGLPAVQFQQKTFVEGGAEGSAEVDDEHAETNNKKEPRTIKKSVSFAHENITSTVAKPSCVDTKPVGRTQQLLTGQHLVTIEDDDGVVDDSKGLARAEARDSKTLSVPAAQIQELQMVGATGSDSLTVNTSTEVASNVGTSIPRDNAEVTQALEVKAQTNSLHRSVAETVAKSLGMDLGSLVNDPNMKEKLQHALAGKIAESKNPPVNQQPNRVERAEALMKRAAILRQQREDARRSGVGDEVGSSSASTAPSSWRRKRRGARLG